MRQILVLCAALAGLAACGGPEPLRYAAPPAEPGARVAIGAASVELREVSLPAYARDEQVWRETAAGTFSPDPEALWADEPARAVTLALARQLGEITGRRVAAEPWPFESLPAARLDVRVSEMIAGADGRFRIAAEIYASRLDIERDRLARVAVSAPIAPDSGLPGLAAARESALRDLARRIAAEAL